MRRELRRGFKPPARREVVIGVPNRQALMALLHRERIDLVCGGPRRVGARGYQLRAIASDDSIARWRRRAVTVRVGQDVDATARARRRERARAVVSAPAARGVRDGLGDTYRSSAELDAALGRLSIGHVECAIIALPHRTIGGRTCRAVRLRSGAAGARPTVLITGGLHAREWVPPEACTAFVAELLNAFGRGSELRFGAARFPAATVRRIFERLEVLVFPNVNPDGREHSLGHDAMWRRNRNPVESGGRPACVGVDVNRNFPFLWDFEHRFSTAAAVATASDPCDASQTYRGDAPASEPETRNVIAAMDTSSSLSWYVDVHSFGERILHPWGDDENQTANPSMTYRNADYDERRGLGGDTGYREFISPADAAALRDAAERMRDAVKKVRGHQYVIQQSFALYPASGCSDDYAFARRWTAAPNRPGISSFTIESGKEFQPRWDEARRVVQEIAAALTALCARAAGAGS